MSGLVGNSQRHVLSCFGSVIYSLQWGCDLQKEHEQYLVRHCDNTPVFVTDFPASIKPFYAKANTDTETVGFHIIERFNPYMTNGLFHPINWMSPFPNLGLSGAFFYFDLIFSLPEPKAHRWAYSIGRHPSSVRHQSSSVKIVKRDLLWSHEADLSPNFTYCIYRPGEQIIVFSVSIG